MESIRRQIHDESTMILLLDKHLDNDQRELGAINEAETTRADQVCSIISSATSIGNGICF
jgi:hypothetical protein